MYCQLFNIIVETFSGKPTRLEVLTHLASIDHLWRSVGNGLGVSYNVLQGLADSSMSNQTRLDHVIQTWLDMDGHGEGVPVAWSAIIDVIKGPLVQHKNLAKKICQYLQQENDEGQIAQSKCPIVSVQPHIIDVDFCSFLDVVNYCNIHDH